MAIPFAEPDPPLNFFSSHEIEALDTHFALRNVPERQDGRLLLASWNIANLGAQDRPDRALSVIAHILKRFDLIAVQEVNDNFRNFRRIVSLMGDEFDFIISDTAGNDERLAFIYDTHRVETDKLWGEVAFPERHFPRRDVVAHYRQNGKEKSQKFKRFRFQPFDRNPFIGSFRSGTVGLVLANVHLYFGAFQNSGNEANRLKYARRVLEIFALAKWADRVSKGGNAWDRDIILLGDMNIPNMEQNESTIRALKEFGWQSLDYVSNQTIGTDPTQLSHVGGTNLGNDKTYDQIAFAPTALNQRISSYGVFDFDNAIFRTKWDEIAAENGFGASVRAFSKYVKYYISDHRPLWVQLRTT